jgi:hypothetical protein
MHEAGCYSVTYGVESGSQKILNSMGKKITLKQIRYAVRTTLDIGMKVTCFFMFPQPDDTEDTIREQKQLMKDLQRMGARLVLSFTTPYPGTYYYEHADELGIKTLVHNWDEYQGRRLTITTKHLSENKLKSLIQEMVREVGMKITSNESHIISLIQVKEDIISMVKKLSLIGLWSFLTGSILAIVAGIYFPANTTIIIIILILGLIFGIFVISEKQSVPYIMATISVIVVANLFTPITTTFKIGEYVGQILTFTPVLTFKLGGYLGQILTLIGALMAPAAVISAIKILWAISKPGASET